MINLPWWRQDQAANEMLEKATDAGDRWRAKARQIEEKHRVALESAMTDGYREWQADERKRNGHND